MCIEIVVPAKRGQTQNTTAGLCAAQNPSLVDPGSQTCQKSVCAAPCDLILEIKIRNPFGPLFEPLPGSGFGAVLARFVCMLLAPQKNASGSSFWFGRCYTKPDENAVRNSIQRRVSLMPRTKGRPAAAVPKDEDGTEEDLSMLPPSTTRVRKASSNAASKRRMARLTTVSLPPYAHLALPNHLSTAIAPLDPGSHTRPVV